MSIEAQSVMDKPFVKQQKLEPSQFSQGVRISKARDLKNSDRCTKSDPYFICRIGSKGSSWGDKAIQSNGLEFRSQVIKNDLNPDWKFCFNFDLNADWSKRILYSHKELEIAMKIWDRDKLSRDDYLGRVTVLFQQIK